MRDQALPRVVIDTNVFVSRLLSSRSVPAQAVFKAEATGETLVSDATLIELFVVLHRPKLARYVQPEVREAMLLHVVETAIHVPIPFPIRACRDPRDDKFLEVAVHGRADILVTGDSDLLELHPFHGVAILTPAAYLALE